MSEKIRPQLSPGWLLKEIRRTNQEFDALPEWMKSKWSHDGPTLDCADDGKWP